MEMCWIFASVDLRLKNGYKLTGDIFVKIGEMGLM